MPKVRQPHLLAEPQDLFEQRLGLLGEALRNSEMVWKSGVARPARYMKETSRRHASARRGEERMRRMCPYSNSPSIISGS
jgi:hypothetical protein